METRMVERHQSRRQAKKPVRTCVSCRRHGSPNEMVRWVSGPEGQVVPDLAGRSFGRGAWAHPSPDCIRKLPRALSRSFRTNITANVQDLVSLLGAAADHRVLQLLGTARRQSALACGAGVVQEAVGAERAHLVVVARDARAAAKLSEVAKMVASGRACAWGTKAELGRLCGRAETGVVAVLDLRLAERLFGAIAMAPRALGSSGTASAGMGHNDVLTEVE